MSIIHNFEPSLYIKFYVDESFPQKIPTLGPRPIRSEIPRSVSSSVQPEEADCVQIEPIRKGKRNAFLLITLYRSGSTLAGEMFNRNPDFLYYFEPLGKYQLDLKYH